jgi:hypothetical protein
LVVCTGVGECAGGGGAACVVAGAGGLTTAGAADVGGAALVMTTTGAAAGVVTAAVGLGDAVVVDAPAPPALMFAVVGGDLCTAPMTIRSTTASPRTSVVVRRYQGTRPGVELRFMVAPLWRMTGVIRTDEPVSAAVISGLNSAHEWTRRQWQGR